MLRDRKITSLLTREDGASAVLIAFVMVLLMGMAALVIDATGVGFNERRQAQTSADTSVMAGAVGYSIGETDLVKATQALELSRANLDTSYTDAEWQARWESCEDPNIDAVDVGLPFPRAFDPMPNPFDGGATDLECISTSSSFMRVVIPQQTFDTSFGKVLGFDSVSTRAEAIARIESKGDASGLLPFGIPGGAGAGESCLSSSPTGVIQPPCEGSSSGAFGPIESEFFGDFFGAEDCGLPGDPELEQNIALGLDHFVDVWPNALGLAEGSTHPGDVSGYPDVSYDQCRIVSGVLQPQQPGQSFPPNTLRVGVGFPGNPVEAGLISDQSYLDSPSRLQDTTNPTQPLVKRRGGSHNVVWDLDDRGPWYYLTGSGPCSSSSYPSLSTDQKVAKFQTCLTTYTGTSDIFDSSIADSPRFAWAPQYWHARSTTGFTWQPVKEYRMVFLGGLWFNCNASIAGSCDLTFYPDETTTGEMCVPSGTGCTTLNLAQMSAWVLPNEAVPDSVISAFPGGDPSPFITTLYR